MTAAHVERLIGEKAIAAYLGVATEDTVRAWGALAVDPLPLRDWCGSVTGWPPYLDEWKARRDDLAAWRERRPRGEPGLPILVGWPAIVATFPAERCIETAERAARLPYRPLPVIGVCNVHERLHRDGGPPRVWGYRSAIRDWLDWRDRPHVTGGTKMRRVESSAQLALFG